MPATHPGQARSGSGRHAADEPGPPPAPPRTSWWRRLLPGGHVVDLDGSVVIRVRGELDDVGAAQLAHQVQESRRWRAGQVVVVHLAACDFVDVRGFRALLVLADQVTSRSGRLVVLDPPRTLQIMCRAVPGRLTLAPADTDWP